MQQDISQSIEACAAHYGEDSDAMRKYLQDGQKEALSLPNRGPIVFAADGHLDPSIREAYLEYGFYIFEGVLKQEELDDIKADLVTIRATFPTDSGSKVTATGQPALGADCEGLNLLWSKPLGDPLGGTPIANGRHQVKLFEPTPKDDAPKEVPFVLLGSLQFSETALRVYGHPQLLKIAADINGDDFAPFNETLFLKDAGVGAAVSWHQDGDTHWESDAFNEGIHGFNFMAQVYGSTAVNGVWVIPGSHKLGRLNIKQMVADAGCERLPGAIPMICDAGDVVICNRQIVHGSFANTGYEPRVTVNFGFHRRSSVLNVVGAGIHSESVIYDEELIRKRSEPISYGIEARRQRFPNETPYNYTLKDNALVWNEEAKQSLKDYNMLDLSI